MCHCTFRVSCYPPNPHLSVYPFVDSQVFLQLWLTSSGLAKDGASPSYFGMYVQLHLSRIGLSPTYPYIYCVPVCLMCLFLFIGLPTALASEQRVNQRWRNCFSCWCVCRDVVHDGDRERPDDPLVPRDPVHDLHQGPGVRYGGVRIVPDGHVRG